MLFRDGTAEIFHLGLDIVHQCVEAGFVEVVFEVVESIFESVDAVVGGIAGDTAGHVIDAVIEFVDAFFEGAQRFARGGLVGFERLVLVGVEVECGHGAVAGAAGIAFGLVERVADLATGVADIVAVKRALGPRGEAIGFGADIGLQLFVARLGVGFAQVVATLLEHIDAGASGFALAHIGCAVDEDIETIDLGVDLVEGGFGGVAFDFGDFGFGACGGFAGRNGERCRGEGGESRHEEVAGEGGFHVG